MIPAYSEAKARKQWDTIFRNNPGIGEDLIFSGRYLNDFFLTKKIKTSKFPTEIFIW
jgi:hypothetical protein